MFDGKYVEMHDDQIHAMSDNKIFKRLLKYVNPKKDIIKYKYSPIYPDSLARKWCLCFFKWGIGKAWVPSDMLNYS